MRFDIKTFGWMAFIMFRVAWMFEPSLGRALLIVTALVTLPATVILGLVFAVRF